jgi:hypothetical protein
MNHRARSVLVPAVPLVLALAALVAPARARAEAKPSDPRAVAIADAVMKALGGKERWDALPGLRWSFGSSVNDTVRSTRRHAWSKHTGWHRVEGTTTAGGTFCLIHNLDTGEGRAWMDGNPIEGDSLRKLLVRAKNLWINDTYWMLMPYKLRDPGVTLGLDGEHRDGGQVWDKLTLSFDNVGRTPGDRYWVYVNRATQRVERWDMVLEGEQPPPRTYTWEGWQPVGGLWFPTAHRDGPRNVFTNRVEAVTSFRPGEFEKP